MNPTTTSVRIRWMKHRISLFFALLTNLANPAALAAGFSPVDVLNFLTPSRTYTLHEGVSYGPLHRQRLDVYVPRAAQPPRGWPVVVFYYGGSWNRGERAQYRFVGEALASRGILTLAADYRLYPEVRYPDFLRDSAAALSYGLSHAADWGSNPDKVYVMGHSAEAYNAAMMALVPRCSFTRITPTTTSHWTMFSPAHPEPCCWRPWKTIWSTPNAIRGSG